MKTKLSLRGQKWFAYYKGYVYANRPSDIHSRINNKVIIDNLTPSGV